ncbi:MAG: deoxyhypusine synthase family protein, partial [Candidatus Woesearchaeota archaeon]|nr:deoxyhypusine synthase family protein [Candidatus Woesearchaeota archaeon]
SGATPQEAKSWGKVKEAGKNTVVVYSCASITFPLLCQYIRTSVKPRKRKELLTKIDSMMKDLIERAYNNEELKKQIKKHASPEDFKRIYSKIWKNNNK